MHSLVFPEERELTSMQGIIDIKVVSSLLLKPIKLKIENTVISYKNFSLKCRQHMFMVDNIGNTENAKKKKKKNPLSHNPESLTIVKIFKYPLLVFKSYLFH